MALSHLVDTSVLTRLKNEEVRSKVGLLLDEGRAARAGISDLEVGYAARSGNEWDDLMGALEAFELVETDSSHVRRARQVQRLLAARSQRGRKIPDLLIAAAGEAEDLIVLHYDSDFDLIAGVTGQQCEWVVRPGKID